MAVAIGAEGVEVVVELVGRRVGVEGGHVA